MGGGGRKSFGQNLETWEKLAEIGAHSLIMGTKQNTTRDLRTEFEKRIITSRTKRPTQRDRTPELAAAG